MESKIPVPTDNIYKFVATFGLVVTVASLTLMILNSDSTNKAIWDAAFEYYDLSASADPLKEKKTEIIEKQIKVASSNRVYGSLFLSILFAIGSLISVEGFRRWFKFIQPLSDEILELQRDKLRLEVEQLRKASGATK